MKVFSLFLFLQVCVLCLANGQEGGYVSGMVYWSAIGQPAVGVEVFHDSQGGTFTKETGYFEIFFPTEKRGATVHLTLGDDDKDGTRLELLPGQKMTCIVQVPPVVDYPKIKVGPIGKFYEDANKFSQTIESSVQKREEADSAALQQVLADPLQNPQEHVRQKNALQARKDKYKSIKPKLEEKAVQLASIHQDTAQLEVAKIVNNIQRIQDPDELEKALVETFDENLDMAYVLALEQKQKATDEIYRVIGKIKLEAEAKHRDSSYAAAAKRYEKICSIILDNYLGEKELAEYQFYAAEEWFSAKEYHRATKLYERCIETRQRFLRTDHDRFNLSPLYHRLAKANFEKGDYDDAFDRYEDCAQLISNYHKAPTSDLIYIYFEMAKCKNKMGSPGEAEEKVEEAERLIGRQNSLNPREVVEAYKMVANLYTGLGKKDKAQKVYKSIIGQLEKGGEAQSAQLGEFLQEIARDYFNKEDFDEAINYWNRASAAYAKASPPDSFQVQKVQGLLFMAQKGKALQLFNGEKYEEAILLINEIAPTAEDRELYNISGLSYYHLGQYDAALKMFEKCYNPEAKRQEPEFYSQCGLAHLNNKDEKKAKKHFEDYEQHPNHEPPIVQRNWAAYYAMKGDKEKALKALQDAINKGFTDLDWLQDENSLDSLREMPAFMDLVKKVEAMPRQ